ncbi:MAG: hypothetical protein EAY66_09430 [Sphingobacteriales bacterium]|jgi:hypothetical protein|nr:MAG: hypothetical protein EAY66_09430 [Sphingobacteriales bacterium]
MLPIKNINDLQSHIHSLELKRVEHELFLRQKAASIEENLMGLLKTYSYITSFFKGNTWTAEGNTEKNDKSDWVTILTRVVVPFALNKVFFKKSSFIVKSLISLVSQGAISSVNKNTVAGWVDMLTDFIKSKTKKKQPLYDGIPPDSETY